MAKGKPTTLAGWFNNPQPQYVPLSEVAFGSASIVIPEQLPPNSMRFPNATFNKMLNIPQSEAVWNHGRNGRIF